MPDLDKLLDTLSHLKQQAQIWAQEARTQKSIVLGILRELGLPLRDCEAETRVANLVATLRKDLLDGLELLREADESGLLRGSLSQRVTRFLAQFDAHGNRKTEAPSR